MVAPAVEGIDLFKIVGRSISGWIPSLKIGTTIRQPFCSQLEERLLMWLEYHPLVKGYARGDIGPQFARAYRLPISKHAPFTIGYTFEDKPHDYLPDAAGTLADGKPFIAEAGMEDDKRGDRNLAKAVASVWPWGEVANVEEVSSRLAGLWPANLVDATIWKIVADAAAQGHLLIDLEQFTLSNLLPLALLPPLVPSPLPDTLEPPRSAEKVPPVFRDPSSIVPGPTFDASRLPKPVLQQFHRNLRAVEKERSI